MPNNELAGKPVAYSYIRMSTDVQLKGDSHRRQTAASQQYAADHALELAPPIEDLGVSGFRGSNREFGNLSRFLDQIERGLVQRGSYLIVESLDRLSRQNVLQAFTLLGQIIQRGVKVVTLMDGQVYDETSFSENQGQIFLALGSMLRAHEESRVKSKRVAAAWVQKRSEAHTKKLTAVMPAWLRLSADRKTINIRPERGTIVREIFELARDGYGAYSIARRFNRRKEPTWTPRATLWHESYVKKILENRAVLGEYQPGAISYDDGPNRKHIAVGDPIANYYPAAIEESLFLAAHAAIDARRTGGRGRKGPKYTNLFTGVAKCGHCGYPMRLSQSGLAQVYDGTYLRCSSSRSQAGCLSPPWKYSHFEQSFIGFLRKVDLRYVLGGQKQDELAAQLEQRRLAIENEIAKTSHAINNLVSAIAESAAVALSKRVSELEVKTTGLEAEKAQVVNALGEIEQRRGVMSKEEISSLLDRISRNTTADFDDAPRRLLASEINRVIKRIDLFCESAVQPWDAETSEEASRIEAMTLWERRMASSYYIIHYRTGESEYIRPYDGAGITYRSDTRQRIEASKARED